MFNEDLIVMLWKMSGDYEIPETKKGLIMAANHQLHKNVHIVGEFERRPVYDQPYGVIDAWLEGWSYIRTTIDITFEHTTMDLDRFEIFCDLCAYYKSMDMQFMLGICKAYADLHYSGKMSVKGE